MLRLGNVAVALACSLVLTTSFATVALAEEPAAPSASPSATSTPTPTPSSIQPTPPPTEVPAPAAEPSDTTATPLPSTQPSDATQSPLPTAASRLEAAAAVMPASIGSLYQFGDDSLCPGEPQDATVTNTSGAISIDLSSLAGYAEIEIDGNATASCRSDITGLTFSNRPTNLTAITIGDDAFAQVDIGTANHLANVSFPAGITELRIGSRAFQQETGAGSNTLAGVSFPDSLERLIIGEAAFAQTVYAADATNALAAVTLHARTGQLSIAYAAFRQESAQGGNALATVTFDLLPLRTGDDDVLVIGGAAFAQSADRTNALTAISFPAGYREVQLGASAFAQTSGAATSLATVTFDPAVEMVSVGESAFSQRAQTHTSLAAVHFPDSITGLYISDYAFWQEGKTGTSLAEVTFPQAPELVSVSRSGFRQDSQEGDCTLSTVTFPDTLEVGLGLDSYAFKQSCAGRAALATLTLPRQTPILYLGGQAFAQNAASNALTSVVFPTTVDALTIGEDAFDQSGTQVLRRILFPFSTPPSQGITTGESMVSDPSTVDWQWFGPDRANLGSWPELAPDARMASSADLKVKPANRGGNLNQALVGYRTLSLRNLTSTDETVYVYRDGTTRTSPLTDPTAHIGAGSWATALPTTTRAGNTFAGWCDSALDGAVGCPTTTHAAGSSFALTSDTSLWASWTTAAIAPTIPQQSFPDATVGTPFHQVITVTGTEPVTCSLTAGHLPPGLSLADCTVSGTPKTAGDYRFTITATNSGGSASRAFRMSVTAAGTDAPNLAYTGTDATLPLVGLAVALTMAGTVLLIAVGHRRRLGQH
jgi:hypothetical protein